jgi:glycerol-3-phosphate dehydrogenase subunit B
MSLDLIIIGSGLTGLFAANLAVDQGLTVQVISSGRGGLSLSHGCIDIYNSSNPSRSIKSLSENHPYKIVSSGSIKASVNAFKSMASESGIDYHGGMSSSFRLLSVVGSPYRTSLVPVTLIKGRLDDPSPITIAGLENYRDFWSTRLSINAKRHGIKIRSTIDLPMLPLGNRRDLYSIDIAKLMLDDVFREELWRAWKPKLTGKKRVGIPAILGTHAATDLMMEAEEYFGVEIFEIPTLPPSLPGLRLETALKQRCSRLGAQLTEGPSALGRIDGRSKGRLTAGVQIRTAGGIKLLNAKAVLLATGGFLHGGLQAQHDGKIIESVYGIPIQTFSPRAQWTSSNLWETQNYSYHGLTTDKLMRPLDHKRKPFLENLFAAGGILHGADRTQENSRQGIGLATAYQAIQSIVATGR